jgi:hypothetical protein
VEETFSLAARVQRRGDKVEHEVRGARGWEKEIGRDVLCPVALDDSWKSGPWPKLVMGQVMEYNILSRIWGLRSVPERTER